MSSSSSDGGGAGGAAAAAPRPPRFEQYNRQDPFDVYNHNPDRIYTTWGYCKATIEVI